MARPYKERILKSIVVKVGSKKYRMFFAKRTDKKDGSSWTWTKIKPYGTDFVISSYVSDSKAEGYRKGMTYLRMKGR